MIGQRSYLLHIDEPGRAEPITLSLLVTKDDQVEGGPISLQASSLVAFS